VSLTTMKKSRKNNVFIVLLLCCKAEKRVRTTLEVRLGYGVKGNNHH